MNIFERLRKIFGGKEKRPKGLFMISTSLEPFRLNAHKNNKVDLTVRVKNISGKEKLVSVVVACPRELGLSETMTRKREQKELGTMKPNDEKTVCFSIYASTSTPTKQFKIPVVVYSHYLDYEHIENAARKMIVLRSV